MVVLLLVVDTIRRTISVSFTTKKATIEMIIFSTSRHHVTLSLTIVAHSITQLVLAFL